MRRANKHSKTYRFVDYISFNMADKIVCATVGPFAWLEEPLREFYGPLTVSAKELKAGFELPDGFDLGSVSQPYQASWHRARLVAA
jgi:hypothetical protein